MTQLCAEIGVYQSPRIRGCSAEVRGLMKKTRVVTARSHAHRSNSSVTKKSVGLPVRFRSEQSADGWRPGTEASLWLIKWSAAESLGLRSAKMSTPAAQMPGVGRGGHTVTPFTCSSLASLATGAPLWLSWTEAGEKRECDCETQPLCSQTQVQCLGKISWYDCLRTDTGRCLQIRALEK